MAAERYTNLFDLLGGHTMPISQRRTAVAATVLAAACALTLSACGSSGGSSHASASNAPSASQTGAAAGATPSAAPATGGSTTVPAAPVATVQSSAGTAAPAGTAQPAPTAASGSAGTPRCHTQDLTLSFETGGDAAPDVTSNQQQTAGIAVHNRSGHTCLAGGFPGVDLNGGSVTWSLARKSAHYSPIALHPGDTTDFKITFQPEPQGTWTPKTVTVTPPNETTSATLAWPWGPVLLQDGATHPVTYVGPIG
jgi:hypothetical protein